MERENWRLRALARLEENKDYLSTSLTAEELEDLTKIANYYDPTQEKHFFEENEDTKEENIAECEDGRYIEKAKVKTEVLCRAKNSFLQQVFTLDLPLHLQVVVPNAAGTNDLTQVETFEINTWFIALSRIAAELDVGLVFFEFCTATAPLEINIFIAPTNDKTPHLFRSNLEEGTDDLSEIQLIRLNTHIQKNVFRKGSLYTAVTFDDQPGIGKIFEGGRDPVRACCDIVRSMWEDAKDEPPETFVEEIKNYKNWPK